VGGYVLFDTLLRKRDFYAGMLMTLLGIGVTFNSTTYNLGTLMHMGPGMFPFLLGILLTLLGLVILASGILTPLGEDEHILPKQKEWKAWACILAGPVSFIVAGEYLGMVPATFSCVVISAMGDREATWKGSILLAAGVAVVSLFLFSYILQIPFPMFRWGR